MHNMQQMTHMKLRAQQALGPNKCPADRPALLAGPQIAAVNSKETGMESSLVSHIAGVACSMAQHTAAEDISEEACMGNAETLHAVAWQHV